MINILLPSMGKSVFFKEAFFPKLLTEIKGKTMIELVVDNYATIDNKSFIFVLDDDECRRFYIDESACILAPDCHIIKLKNKTAGALCTCLMAIDRINTEDPLIIANSDQIIDVDYIKVLDYFNQVKADAGVITFHSVHPRWSYVRIKGDSVVEVAEKRPLSKNAIAGFYYYRHGKEFIETAKMAVLKQNNLDGNYYISSSMNELLLLGKKVSFYEISQNQYSSFYSPEKIKEYEGKCK